MPHPWVRVLAPRGDPAVQSSPWGWGWGAGAVAVSGTGGSLRGDGLVPLLPAAVQRFGGWCFSARFSQRRNSSGDGQESFLEKRAPITSLACAVLTVIAY